MSLLRLTTLFIFAALAVAKAQCVDFDILSNGTSLSALGKTSVSTSIMIGEDLELTISPSDENAKWKIGNTPFGHGSSYSPPTKLDAIGNTEQTHTYIAENSCGTQKTIFVTMLARTYTVTFNANGGSPTPPTQTIFHNEKATIPAAPTKTGYTFEGWDFNFNTPILQNTTLTANWKVISYTVSFNTGDGGSAVPSQSVDYGTKAYKPADPIRGGYDFDGWEFDFNTLITQNTTVNAKWKEKPKYTVTFNTGAGGSAVSPYTGITHGNVVPKPSPDPTRPGYDFNGWNFDFNTPITQNITLNANWKIKTYTVSFNTGAGGSAVSSQKVDYGATATAPATIPTRTGYDFDGWDFNFSTQITQNTTINAKWKPKTYTVSFNTGAGGSAVSSQIVDYGTTATVPATIPTRTGYDFDGWDFNFSTIITQNTIITAKWKVKICIVQFEAYGAAINPQSITYGAKATKPTIRPTRAGYVFDDWNFDFNTPITNDITIAANWIELVYDLPSGLTYSKAPISPVVVTGVSSAVTVLYNKSEDLPVDAGTYTVSAYIDPDTILLGSITINKKYVYIPVISVTPKNKTYNGTLIAEIADITFDESNLFEGDAVSENDYSINANFVSPNAGNDIAITGTVIWLPSGALSKNYSISPNTTFNTKANIAKAQAILKISPPHNYELSSPTKPSINSKSPFIKEENIIWEYKRENETEYVKFIPNRIGNWAVRATYGETENYTAAADSAIFKVTRGNLSTVIHDIVFEESGFEKDYSLSKELQNYFVTDACGIKTAKIKISVYEYDIVLYTNKIPQKGEADANGFLTYEFPVAFGKPGLDTLIYSLVSNDGIYSESDTILIETPIPFDSVVLQKWNNVMFVNNNPKTNGGYEFIDFKWFKIENSEKEQINNLQFYSAGPTGKDVLNPKDIYKVTMQTAGGIRISTCEGSSKIKTLSQQTKPPVTKQVLGVNGKAVKNNAKIYNLNGLLVKEAPAGIYLVEEE